MKLRFWRRMMWLAWIIDDCSDTFVEWTQQKYSNEVHGIGSIK